MPVMIFTAASFVDGEVSTKNAFYIFSRNFFEKFFFNFFENFFEKFFREIFTRHFFEKFFREIFLNIFFEKSRTKIIHIFIQSIQSLNSFIPFRTLDFPDSGQLEWGSKYHGTFAMPFFLGHKPMPLFRAPMAVTLMN